MLPVQKVGYSFNAIQRSYFMELDLYHIPTYINLFPMYIYISGLSAEELENLIQIQEENNSNKGGNTTSSVDSKSKDSSTSKCDNCHCQSTSTSTSSNCNDNNTSCHEGNNNGNTTATTTNNNNNNDKNDIKSKIHLHNYVCYGCRIILRECKDDIEEKLPSFVEDQVGKMDKSSQLRTKIKDFLLDSESDEEEEADNNRNKKTNA